MFFGLRMHKSLRMRMFCISFYIDTFQIHHFTVACLVAWPLNESEAGGDIVLLETFLLYLC